MKFTYTGWFIERDISRFAHLDKAIEHPHVTLAFKPENPFREHFGTTARIRVIGYANDGKNQGWECRVLPHDKFLLKEAQKIKVPHITISVSADGKPVDTAKLEFHRLEKPFDLAAIYGGFCRGKIITERG